MSQCPHLQKLNQQHDLHQQSSTQHPSPNDPVANLTTSSSTESYPLREIPRSTHVDVSLSILFSQGFKFIKNECDKLKTDIFQSRLGGESTIFMFGEEAAKLFYDESKFKRKGVAPITIRKSLLGDGGAHGLDGEAHRERKAIFMSLMTPDCLEMFNKYMTQAWEDRIRTWPEKKKVILLHEVSEIFTIGICKWAGVPLQEDEVKRRANDLFLMVDAFGSVGPRNWKGILARKRAEHWMKDLVRKIRDEEVVPPKKSSAYVFSFHQDGNGERLSEQIAAVEILNSMRPTLAVGYFVVFAALTLHKYPEYRNQLRTASDEELEQWVQEVRRVYPFAPCMGAYTRRAFDWKGYHFPEGQRVVIDFYGTNHDPRSWATPEEFNPDHFKTWNRSAYNFIPHGGGGFEGHRCAGEWLAINLLKISTKILVNRVEYRVPNQDLSFPMTRMPTICKSHFIMDQVRLIPGSAQDMEIPAEPEGAFDTKRDPFGVQKQAET
mmetsp:Transcript_8160/g.30211  ORF Transcript_8160/g.30211 Transcript_8160/m.30211 type:complete len:492 (-) Transcript_8160:494-1969(-)|eukprot:CAMPEP_0117437618 /NCGR_PEP_ID=MMETSP0759-20121206/1623_1 /TAXON_ID=63605 /ORGANISM="Percolomonas cosmopolitus, Strain WS" /LENGTH=491 /DNA_ID=CAMNT_0005229269 /DNA_START=269 /DNA_END=1744 /DNA_ORIENTATION=+